MSSKIALLGGGGLAIEIIEYMLSDGIEIAGYYALEEDADCSRWVRYLGDERGGFSRDYRYLIASGEIAIRKKMIAFLERNDLEVASFISSRAYISRFASYGKGLVVCPFAALLGNAVLGDHTLMNIHASIGHHCVVGSNDVFSPRASMNGHCVVGNDCTIGTGCAFVPGVKIGDDVVVGAGATIVSDLTEPGVYVGTPARKIR